MKYTRKTLKNGLNVFLVNIPDAQSVVFTIFVKVGSRYERVGEAGVAHFLEHVFFKGSQNYPSPTGISTLIDAIGGDFNAATSKESTEFYIHAEKHHFDLIFNVLTDMIQNPLFNAEELEKEKGVVIEEINLYQDNPGAQVESDAWQLDFVLTGSQKALALPPGLALGVAQPAALERARATPNRGIYFDLVEFESFIVKNQTPNTPALSLMYALAAQVERIDAESIETRWARHQAMAHRTWHWTESMNGKGVALEVLAPREFRSPTVTCIKLPSGVSGSAVDKEMKRRGYTISPGYGALKDSTIRIGHMGDHTVDELNELLQVLEDVLRS